MDLKLVPFLHFIILTTSVVEPKAPQVYEDVDETPLDLTRTTRQPNQRFNFLDEIQTDQQKWRYHQQQQIDSNNPFSKKYSLQRRRRIPNLKKREIHGRNHKRQAIYPLNFGLNHVDNLKLLQESFGGSQQQEKDIQALNALIGKNPTLQLEGLKQLLGPKDHTPIIEDVVDVENPQNRPNIKVESAPPEYQEAVAHAHVIQADFQNRLKQQNLLRIAQMEQELNALVQAQAQEALAKAQQEASAEVVAQQKTLAAAQAQAEKTALEEAEVQAEALYGHGPRLVQYPPAILQENAAEDSKKAYGGNKDLQYASQYAFGYRVRDYHSGNNFGHEEISDGKTAKGHYHVLLPDGRLQNVQYWADETGFHAKVTYDKLAQH